MMVVVGRIGKGYMELGGQKAAHYDVESSLADWVISQRENMHLRVTRQLMALQGKQMIQDPDFKASRGWIDHFLCVIGIRMKTTVGQHLPPDVCSK